MSFRNVEDVDWLPNIWCSFIDVSVPPGSLFLFENQVLHQFEIVPSTIQDKVLYVAEDNFLGTLDPTRVPFKS